MTKEAMTLALEALEGSIAITMAKIDLRNTAIKALEEALAKQEQPTVRTGDCLRVGVCASEGHKIQAKQEQGEPDDLTIAYMAGLNRGKDLALQPAQKPLTDEQIYEIHENSSSLMEFTRAIEAAHGIKENT